MEMLPVVTPQTVEDLRRLGLVMEEREGFVRVGVKADNAWVAVVDAAQLKEVGFLVCAPRRVYQDDAQTTCADCGRALFHRPHAPELTKLCYGCAAARREREV